MRTPNEIPSLTEAERARFWAKVDRRGPAECWLWTAAHVAFNTHGRYVRRVGQVRLRYRAFIASRVAYALGHGRDPGALEVCHRCDESLCCNPDHLFLGTHQENMADMARKGRGSNASGPGTNRGAANGQARLTESDVLEIRRLWVEGRLSGREIAVRFGTAAANVHAIVRGENWCHLPVRYVRRDWKTKIDPSALETIAQRKAAGERTVALAAEYGISRSHVDRIARGWRPGDPC
jgi:hypothetical protein